MSWTHNICGPCWLQKHGESVPVRVLGSSPEPCCFCGRTNTDGIYVRCHPNEAPQCVEAKREH